MQCPRARIKYARNLNNFYLPTSANLLDRDCVQCKPIGNDFARNVGE